MIVLLVTALLALGANSVTSEKKVIYIRRCTSGPASHFGYLEVWCRIPSATTKEELHLTVSDVRAPFTCTKGNYKVVEIDGKMYIHVKNGCNAIFEVYTQHIEVSNPSPGECGVANSVSGFRVVGGKTAGECEYPWMVYVFNKARRSFCGGSILDKRHILTAAHCVQGRTANSPYPASHFVIYSGSSNIHGRNMKIKRNAVEKIVAHKDFTYRTLQDDIAVITLKDDLKFDRCQRPVCLSNGTRSVQDGKNCRTMGWGRLSNDHGRTPQDLQWVKEEAVSKSVCSMHYGSMATDKIFCASGENAGICSGDSGGPYVCQHEDGKFYQYGVVFAGKLRSCGTRYALYVYINAYLDWINGAIRSQP